MITHIDAQLELRPESQPKGLGHKNSGDFTDRAHGHGQSPPKRGEVFCACATPLSPPGEGRGEVCAGAREKAWLRGVAVVASICVSMSPLHDILEALIFASALQLKGRERKVQWQNDEGLFKRFGDMTKRESSLILRTCGKGAVSSEIETLEVRLPCRESHK